MGIVQWFRLLTGMLGIASRLMMLVPRTI